MTYNPCDLATPTYTVADPADAYNPFALLDGTTLTRALPSPEVMNREFAATYNPANLYAPLSARTPIQVPAYNPAAVSTLWV